MKCTFWFTITLLLITPQGASALPWKRVIGADTSALSSADKKRAASLMKKINCYYGCSDPIATCLTSAPQCKTARHLAGHIIRMVKRGRSDKKIKRAIMLRAKSAHPFIKRTIRPNKRQCLGDPKKAKVVIVSYSDFQCPFCTIILPRVEAMVRGLKDTALCFKNFPTLAHGRGTVVSSIAAVAASFQGKFWLYHNLLYKNRKNQGREQLLKFAKKLRLDMARFNKDFSSRKAKRIVAKEKKEGLKYRVKGTPTLFFNGKMYYGRKDRALIMDRIEEERFLAKGEK